MPKLIPVTIGSATYPSITQAAAAIGVSVNALCQRLARAARGLRKGGRPHKAATRWVRSVDDAGWTTYARGACRIKVPPSGGTTACPVYLYAPGCTTCHASVYAAKCAAATRRGRGW